MPPRMLWIALSTVASANPWSGNSSVITSAMSQTAESLNLTSALTFEALVGGGARALRDKVPNINNPGDIRFTEIFLANDNTYDIRSHVRWGDFMAMRGVLTRLDQTFAVTTEEDHPASDRLPPWDVEVLPLTPGMAALPSFGLQEFLSGRVNRYQDAFRIAQRRRRLRIDDFEVLKVGKFRFDPFNPERPSNQLVWIFYNAGVDPRGPNCFIVGAMTGEVGPFDECYLPDPLDNGGLNAVNGTAMINLTTTATARMNTPHASDS